MQETEKKEDSETTKKYLALISIINRIEKRLAWSELTYLFMNIIIVIFVITFISYLNNKVNYILTTMDLAFILFLLVIGISVCAYWTGSSMRIQLKLKLRYFQARFLERKMNCTGEYIFSDESIFFDPDLRKIESPDKKETLDYPTSGLLRMDGVIGSAKPRHFTLLLPSIFFIIYCVIFLWMMMRFFEYRF